jgi:hypothetical protein
LSFAKVRTATKHGLLKKIGPFFSSTAWWMGSFRTPALFGVHSIFAPVFLGQFFFSFNPRYILRHKSKSVWGELITRRCAQLDHWRHTLHKKEKCNSFSFSSGWFLRGGGIEKENRPVDFFFHENCATYIQFKTTPNDVTEQSASTLNVWSHYIKNNFKSRQTKLVII